MTAATVIGHGQINGSGAADALFLKLYSGETLMAFAEANIMMDKHLVKPISNGKSAQFPHTHKVSSGYHTPGAELTGQAINHNEKVITVDDMLVADVFLPEIDELKSHFEVRSVYSMEAGRELSYVFDENVLRCAVLAARASAIVTGGNGGTQLTNADYDTDGSVLAGGMYDAAQAFDEKDIPPTDRHAAFKPAQYYLLPQTTSVINKDWGGEGSYARGNVTMIAEIPIHKTNHLPTADDSANSNIPAKYRADYSNTIGVIWHRYAAGTVKLRDILTEVTWDPRRLGWLITSRMAVGHDYLRPDCGIELKVA